MSILAAALECAGRGWRVVPLHPIGDDGRCPCPSSCGHPGKHPRIRAWPSRASRDPAEIQEWFQRWPESNLGVVTGRSSGLLVIDIDPGRDGDHAFAALEAEHGKLPETAESISGGGGRHIWLRYPE